MAMCTRSLDGISNKAVAKVRNVEIRGDCPFCNHPKDRTVVYLHLFKLVHHYFCVAAKVLMTSGYF